MATIGMQDPQKKRYIDDALKGGAKQSDIDSFLTSNPGDEHRLASAFGSGGVPATPPMQNPTPAYSQTPQPVPPPPPDNLPVTPLPSSVRAPGAPYQKQDPAPARDMGWWNMPVSAQEYASYDTNPQAQNVGLPQDYQVQFEQFLKQNPGDYGRLPSAFGVQQNTPLMYVIMRLARQMGLAK